MQDALSIWGPMVQTNINCPLLNMILIACSPTASCLGFASNQEWSLWEEDSSFRYQGLFPCMPDIMLLDLGSCWNGETTRWCRIMMASLGMQRQDESTLRGVLVEWRRRQKEPRSGKSIYSKFASSPGLSFQLSLINLSDKHDEHGDRNIDSI